MMFLAFLWVSLWAPDKKKALHPKEWLAPLPKIFPVSVTDAGLVRYADTLHAVCQTN
jgi:type II secretory pathway component PulM